MSAVTDAAQALVDAAKSVEGLRYSALGDNVDPPGVVLGPPLLEWEGVCSAPTSATFTVFLIVSQDDRALDRLWLHLEPLTEALDAVRDAVVRTATPGVYTAGAQDLPCYTISVEVSL